MNQLNRELRNKIKCAFRMGVGVEIILSPMEAQIILNKRLLEDLEKRQINKKS